MSAPRKLETLRDVLRRDYKRRWRRKHPEKAQEYRARAVAKQVDREMQAKQGILV